MQLFLIATTLLPFVASASSVVSCGDICTDFAYERNDLAVCSSRDNAEIWNTTSGECKLRIGANLKTVSYMSMIFTLGVTPAVRHPIGDECWDYVPENVAVSIIGNLANFDQESVCDSHPSNSPSIGWEMRYTMETRGYNDCASLVVLHDDYLVSCVRLHADARSLATSAYFLAIAIGLMLFCILPCVFLR